MNEHKKEIKIELYNDHFENAKRYAIPRAQLIIADIPYNIGINAYGSRSDWYIDGDNKNGESKKAGSAFFDTDDAVSYTHLDVYKRQACFNWGIGRELYTAPFTYVTLSENEFYEDKGKFKVKSGVKFRVSAIEYASRRISKLSIVDKAGNIRYSYGYSAKKQEQQNG